ncbi:hypothetical protein AB0I28_23265 [Phytomonospora sp. NPDC050363]|uniref:alpha/beta hydrolase family protein n=1 Tax=Phytomonospora sp. NPDC050363 TaxID=3155642 RepID=UPI003401BB38
MAHEQPAGARAVLLSPSAAQADPVLALPEPSGPLPVGVSTLHLVDGDRADPWVPSARRELMVPLWYPTLKPSAVTAAYMTAEESRVHLEASGVPAPPDLMANVGTHATVDPRPLRTHRGLPLVVLSPGFGMPRATLTGLAEELASRGYAVAAIGHNYEADGISFPDGRTTTCIACEGAEDETIGATRAADVSFVLDELEDSRFGRLVDSGEVAMVGHSAGGFSVIPAMLGDPRVKGGLNMDGNFRYPNDVPVDRPVLMLGQPSHSAGGQDPSWDETWSELTGWKRWLTVDDTAHVSFSDLAVLGDQAGLPQQELDGATVDGILRDYVTAFVDVVLRDCEPALLDGPSPEHPQVRFH